MMWSTKSSSLRLRYRILTFTLDIFLLDSRNDRWIAEAT
jgi:hypothetical protein